MPYQFLTKYSKIDKYKWKVINLYLNSLVVEPRDIKIPPSSTSPEI
jgi:hypothetical protein